MLYFQKDYMLIVYRPTAPSAPPNATKIKLIAISIIYEKSYLL